jgi:transcriptional regulator with PAS, ATPase and Fis domain
MFDVLKQVSFDAALEAAYIASKSLSHGRVFPSRVGSETPGDGVLLKIRQEIEETEGADLPDIVPERASRYICELSKAIDKLADERLGIDVFRGRELLEGLRLEYSGRAAGEPYHGGGDVEAIDDWKPIGQTKKGGVALGEIPLRGEAGETSMFREIIGTSDALRAVVADAARVAPTDATVLITGETGTGKGLIARAIHKGSRRAARPFITVNCAAIPSSLIASELFGHEKGAFTGALQSRQGRFELAHSGTIFLDEIGELPAETQVALLGVLQERQFERVGGNSVIRTDVRMIAATNSDLAASIASGTFRADLFYRLNVFSIDLPPLREREEDIPLLAEYFIDHFARRAGKKIRTVSRKTLALLRSYSWPGNIRELQNVIERSVLLCESENLSIDDSRFSSVQLARELKGEVDLPPTPRWHLVRKPRPEPRTLLRKS